MRPPLPHMSSLCSLCPVSTVPRHIFIQRISRSVSGFPTGNTSRLLPASFLAPRRPFSSMSPNQQNGAETNGSVEEGSHQYQAGNTTHRKEDEWKHRDPYRIHDEDENFPVKWKGSCHCGKIKYQLSREKPLASKYCHCTTCQRLHGVSPHQNPQWGCSS